AFCCPSGWSAYDQNCY
nr:RecName: Full=Snaclec factor X-activator 2 light chain 2; Short=VAFXA-II LC2 [Vipera ammodytes ammodytes]